ncbi:MAG: hypothetical protein NTZ05_08640, partial [Chloroflexi bacterium]|nr:hypothetical protein [Chloroflexota bacterium]
MRWPVRAGLQVGLATMLLFGLGVVPAQTLATDTPSLPPTAVKGAAPLLTAPIGERPRLPASLERPTTPRAADKGPEKMDGPLGQLVAAYGAGGLVRAQAAADTAG